VEDEGKNTDAAVANDEGKYLGAMSAMGVANKSTGDNNHPVDSTDRKNKNSSEKETAIMKKKITLNEDGEVVRGGEDE